MRIPIGYFACQLEVNMKEKNYNEKENQYNIHQV